VCVCVYIYIYRERERERETDRKKDTFRETNLLLTLFNIHDLSVYPQNHLNFPVVTVSHKNT